MPKLKCAKCGTIWRAQPSQSETKTRVQCPGCQLSFLVSLPPGAPPQDEQNQHPVDQVVIKDSDFHESDIPDGDQNSATEKLADPWDFDLSESQDDNWDTGESYKLAASNEVEATEQSELGDDVLPLSELKKRRKKKKRKKKQPVSTPSPLQGKTLPIVVACISLLLVNVFQYIAYRKGLDPVATEEVAKEPTEVEPKLDLVMNPKENEDGFFVVDSVAGAPPKEPAGQAFQEHEYVSAEDIPPLPLPEVQPVVPHLTGRERTAARANPNAVIPASPIDGEPRWQPLPVDRSMVKSEISIPNQWTPVPTIEIPKPAFHLTSIGFTGWPQLIGPETYGNARRVGSNDDNPGTLAIQTYSIDTGKSIGKSVSYYPWTRTPLPIRRYRYQRSGLSVAWHPDRQRIALTDFLNDRWRVDVFELEGPHQFGFVPYDSQTQVNWIEWTPGGNLLSLNSDGVLTSWQFKPEQAIAAYELDQQYRQPLKFFPGRSRLMASAGSSLDLIDVETGIILARLTQNIQSDGELHDMALSPDGRIIAGIFGKAKAAITDDDEKLYATVVLWDLESGKQRVRQTPIVRDYKDKGYLPLFVHFRSPEHLLVIPGNQTELIDLKYNLVVAKGAANRPFETTEDGRIWNLNRKPSTLPSFPRSDSPDERVLASPNRTVNLLTATPMAVELRTGYKDADRTNVQRIAERFVQRGFTIGSGGYTMRVIGSPGTSNAKLEITGGPSTPGKQVMALPVMDYTWKLIDPDGEEVEIYQTEGAFPRGSTKYYRKSRSDYLFPNANSSGEVQLLMLEEILEKGTGLTPPGKLPVGYIKARESEVIPPIRLNLNGTSPGR